MRVRRALVTGAAVMLAAACGSNGEDADSPLGRVLLSSQPSKHELVKPPASGPMDLDEAATSTEAGQTKLRRRLGTTGFQEGYARVWKDGEDFVVVLVYEFLSPKRAAGLVRFMATQLADKRSAAAFKVPGIPKAKGSILNARNDRGTSLFCQLAWFSVKERAFGVRVCATTPNSPEQAIELAQEQYAKAKRSAE